MYKLSKSIGLENFEKEILLETSNSEEMFEKEREMVELGPHSYNLVLGGKGGFNNLSKEQLRDNSRKGGIKCVELGLGWFRKTTEERAEQLRRFSGWHSKEHQLKTTNAARSDSANEKRKKTMRDNHHSQGTNNTQYGSMWITNGSFNQKIKKDDIVPEGWRKGRTMIAVSPAR